MFTKNRKGMGGLKDGVGCDKGFPCSVNAGLVSIEKSNNRDEFFRRFDGNEGR